MIKTITLKNRPSKLYEKFYVGLMKSKFKSVILKHKTSNAKLVSLYTQQSV